MAFLFDRIILWILCIFLMMKEYDNFFVPNEGVIVACLITILFTTINSYFEDIHDKKRYLIINSFIFFFCMCFFPETICMLPIFWYDLFGIRTEVIAILLTICGVFQAISLDFSTLGIVSYLLLCGLGVYLRIRADKENELEKLVKKIRDDSEEKRILEEKKNKRILETQDQEIYVATLKERNRIAREIHDHVGHIITRTLLQMGALMTIHKEEPLHEQLNSVKENLDLAMNNIRNSVHDLHDESVDLEQVLKDMANTASEKFICNFEYDITKGMSKECKYAMIGIVKEAVNNTIKYSKNTHLDIILREHPAMYQLVIHDYMKKNGIVDKSRVAYEDNRQKNIKKQSDISKNSTGIGLQNMKDRVEQLKGHIVISNENGFKIFITIPKEKA